MRRHAVVDAGEEPAERGPDRREDRSARDALAADHRRAPRTHLAHEPRQLADAARAETHAFRPIADRSRIHRSLARHYEPTAPEHESRALDRAAATDLP